jgi:hypothetical protein
MLTSYRLWLAVDTCRGCENNDDALLDIAGTLDIFSWTSTLSTSCLGCDLNDRALRAIDSEPTKRKLCDVMSEADALC